MLVEVELKGNCFTVVGNVLISYNASYLMDILKTSKPLPRTVGPFNINCCTVTMYCLMSCMATISCFGVDNVLYVFGCNKKVINNLKSSGTSAFVVLVLYQYVNKTLAHVVTRGS